MSVLPPQYTGGLFMKALESWVDIMHLEKGEPVSTGDETLCEGSSVKCGVFNFCKM